MNQDYDKKLEFYDQLHDKICALLKQLENDKTAEIFRDKWNFITDVETNEITKLGRSAAKILYNELCEYVNKKHEKTKIRKDHFFEMSFYVGSDDFENIQQAVNQGIDSRLTGFTKSEFKYSNNRLFCWIHPDEMEILIRRLLELENDDAELLADAIVLIQYGYEIV